MFKCMLKITVLCHAMSDVDTFTLGLESTLIVIDTTIDTTKHGTPLSSPPWLSWLPSHFLPTSIMAFLMVGSLLSFFWKPFSSSVLKKIARIVKKKSWVASFVQFKHVKLSRLMSVQNVSKLIPAQVNVPAEQLRWKVDLTASVLRDCFGNMSLHHPSRCHTKQLV